ncbi:uncharacterized protein LOC129605882 [Condylostylus longicornis]|uniref:uncharacterized protein LOC129605882 n=1 Tax=Condylostylus longicornis TaxID=2530218 RepID=UPI00244DB3E9|nr:uncharacterized protein LOC129605882 [Condylostylus longicornis]
MILRTISISCKDSSPFILLDKGKDMNPELYPADFKLDRAYKNGIVMRTIDDCSIESSREIFKIADKNNFFTSNNFWLLTITNINDLHIIDLMFKEIFVMPDSDVKILILFKWMLFDIYRISSFKPLKIQMLSANITNSDSFIESLKKVGVFAAKRKNLENIKILCGVVIEFPDAFTTFEDVSTRHINTIAKVNYPLMKNIETDLNFSFDLMQMDNYGWNHSDAHFDGMMGHFQHGTIDFGVNAIFMRLERFTLCDFVSETINIRACIIFRQPPLSAVENIFTLPFSLDVWISCIIFIVITTILLIIHIIFHPMSNNVDLKESLIFVWGAVCQQGFHVDFSSASGRYIVLTTFISTLFLFTSFSANIVALLQSPSEAIKTVNDLSHSPLDAGAQDVKYNKIYFEETTDPETQALYKKKIAPKGENAFIRPHEGMESVRKGLFAYQVESQAAYQVVSATYDEHEKCGLKELELFQLPVMAIPVKKKFPYKELFRQRLRWQRENGLMNREFRKWLPAKPLCENRVAGFVSIGLTESRYPLLYFTFGCGIALLALILELLWHHAKRQLMHDTKE